MTPSRNYIALMKDLEGMKECPYLDSASIPTIGIGSTRYEDGTHVKMTDKCIDEQRAVDLLLHESINNQVLLNHLLPTLTENQNDALLSFIYNVGAKAFQASTLLKRILSNETREAITDAFLMWSKARVNGTLIEVEGLKNRRLKEISLYFS